MAKGTPKANKTAAPAKPASASKGTPKSKAVAAPSTESASKKRVRLADDDSETAAAAAATEDTPAKSAKKAKGGDGKSSKKAAQSTTTTDEVEVGSNGVERKDLKDKRPSEVEQIKSRDAPKPAKGALKKTTSAEAGEDESSKAKKTKGKGKDEVKLAEGGDDADEDDDDEIDFLAGFESGEDDGEDSSDEEMDDDDEEEASKPKFDTRQLPKVKGETVQKKLAAKEKKQAKTGTIYLGRIPKGFYEDEMRSYFSQFGEVTRLRLSRNKKTGASKHYAFIEFKYASVAQIVQETMDNYLLLGHILVCKVVPDDQIHPKLWVGANRKFRVVPKSRKDAARRNKPKTDEQKAKIKKRLLSREDKKRKQLAELGIEYDFAGYRGAGKEEQVEAKVEEAAKPTPKKKGRKSAGGEEQPAKKKARKST